MADNTELQTLYGKEWVAAYERKRPRFASIVRHEYTGARTRTCSGQPVSARRVAPSLVLASVARKGI